MKIIKLITIILLISFLTSCKDKIVCSQINGARIKPLMIYDISFQFNRCRGRCFDFNEWKTLPIKSCIGESDNESIISALSNIQSDSINYPLEYCDGLAGFTIEDMATEIRPKIKKLDGIKKDYCN